MRDQKGFDLIAYVMEEMLTSMDVQFVVLGTGEKRYEDMFRYFQEKYPKEDKRVFREMMTFDLYLRENMKTRPDFAAETSDRKKLFHEVTVYFDLKKQEHVELVSEETLNDLCRLGAYFKIAEMESDDKPEKGKKIIYFDYEKRDPLNHNASVYEVRMI